MRTLEAEQNSLVARSGLSIIRLVKLTVYEDRASRRAPTSFYLADHPVTYDYGNTGTDQEFWPVVASIESQQLSMVHLPRPDDFSSYVGGITVNLSNQEFMGRRLSTILGEVNLLNADIEYSEIAVPSLSATNDLTAKDGDEHTVQFRGNVIDFPEITDDHFSLECAVSLPSMADQWIYADSTDVDPLDVGKRVLRVFGESKRVAMLNWSVGAVTTNNEAFDNAAVDTNIDVTDAIRFPDAGDFDVRFGAEDILCDSHTDTTIHIKAGSSRAQNGTSAASHSIGESVIEQIPSTFVAIHSNGIANVVSELFVINPLNNELHRVTTDFDQKLLSAGINDVVVASVEFLQSDMKLLLDDLIRTSGIDTQPEFESLSGDTVLLILDSVEFIDGGTLHVPSGTGPDDSSIQATSIDPIRTNLSQANGDLEGSHHWVGSVQSGAREVLRWRLIMRIDTVGHSSRDIDVVCSQKFYGRLERTSETISASAPNVVQTVIGDWQTPSSTKTVDDIIRSSAPSADANDNYLSFFIDNLGADHGGSSDGFIFRADESYIEVELAPEALTRTQDVIGGGASVGFGLRFFGDINGQVAPGDDVVPGAAETVVDNLDASAASWTTSNCTIADDGVDFFEGSGSLEVTGSEVSTFQVRRSISTADWTDKAIIFEMKVSAATYAKWIVDTSNAFRFVISSQSDLSTDLKRFPLDVGAIRPDVWQTHHLTVNDDSNFSTGSLDITDVQGIAFRFFFTNGDQSGEEIRLDNLRIADSERIYSADQGDLMTHPVDILTYWVEKVGRETIHRASRTEALANLGSNAIGGDVRALGLSWPEVAQGLAYATRANLVPEEESTGRQWRILTADANYQFAAPSVDLTGVGIVRNVKRGLGEVATHHTFRYDYDSTLGATEEAYRQVVIANPTTSDVPTTAADLLVVQQAIGVVESSPEFFRMVNDTDTAEDNAGYLVQESIAYNRDVYTITEVPWMHGYKLQRGDIVDIAPPWKQFPDSSVFPLDSEAGSWSGVGNGTPGNESTIFREGNGSMKITTDGVGTDIGAERSSGVFNLRDRAITFWVYAPSATISHVDELNLTVSSTFDFASNWVKHTLAASKLASDGWVQYRAPIGVDPDDSAGTYDPTHTKMWRLQWEQDTPAGSQFLIFDDVRIGSPTVSVRIIEINKIHASQQFDITAVEVLTV